MEEIVITHATRTAIGSFLGSLSPFTSSELGKSAISSLLEQSGIEPAEVSEVIMGQVLSTGCGQNPARAASIGAGIPYEIPAWTVNHVCGSGIKSIILAAQSIACRDAKIVIAGGQESMSNAPHYSHIRQARKMGHLQLTDTMLSDGLIDFFSQEHMGSTAENIAKKFNITRQAQDDFAFLSQEKAAKAIAANLFVEEITPVKLAKSEEVFCYDEYVRKGIERSKLSKLKPAFEKDGTVTPGNASGINDGAAALLLMSKNEAQHRGLVPLVTIKSFAQSGVHPSLMGIAPIKASRSALKKAGWSVNELDLIESNEAFAASSIYVDQEMGWDKQIVNVNGGAIALGHPIGASGARIVVTLLHEIKRRKQFKCLATLCIGGGMGIAICFECNY